MFYSASEKLCHSSSFFVEWLSALNAQGLCSFLAQVLKSNVLPGAQEQLLQWCPGLRGSLLPLGPVGSPRSLQGLSCFLLCHHTERKDNCPSRLSPTSVSISSEFYSHISALLYKPSQLTLYTLCYFAI